MTNYRYFTLNILPSSILSFYRCSIYKGDVFGDLKFFEPTHTIEVFDFDSYSFEDISYYFIEHPESEYLHSWTLPINEYGGVELNESEFYSQLQVARTVFELTN